MRSRTRLRNCSLSSDDSALCTSARRVSGPMRFTSTTRGSWAFSPSPPCSPLMTAMRCGLGADRACSRAACGFEKIGLRKE